MIRRSPFATAAVLPALLVALMLALGVAACGSGDDGSTDTSQPGTITITDQAGRPLTIPDSIKTVYCTSPMGTNLMYTLAPEMLVGWNITPTALEKQYIPEQYLPSVGLGGWFGKNTTGNVEEIIKRDPDVILSIGYLDEAAISDADRIQGLLNIPVIMINGYLVDSAETYRYIGELLGVQERAEELAAYCDGVIKEAQTNAALIPDAERVRVYYAEGTKGLNTDPVGSEHTEVLELVGGANVADVNAESEYGMAPVSLEQVLVWNPEVILVASDPKEESVAYHEITTGSQWATMTAVKSGQVYQIPRGPFDWFDRPPCVARILGVRWLGNLLYPDLYQYDMKAEVSEFYDLFFHINLTDAQLETLMARAVRSK